MNDDLNTPRAFAALFDLIRSCNKQQIKPPQTFFGTISDLFGIVPIMDSDVPEDIQKIVDERQLAREQKDWATADQLRDQLAEQGWTIDDTTYGPLVKKHS